MTTPQAYKLHDLAPDFPRVHVAAQQPLSPWQHVGRDGTIVVVGPALDDYCLRALPGQKLAAKVICTLLKRLGGAACNISRAIRDYGGKVKPIFLIGHDQASDEAMAALGDEFPNVLFDRCYAELRLSVIAPDGVCYTTRPRMNRDHATEPIRAALSTAVWTVVAPMAAADYLFVEDLLRIAPRSVLMLSNDQLAHRDQAVRLIFSAQQSRF